VIGSLVALVVGTVAFIWLQPASRQIAVDSGAPGRLVASSATVDLGQVPFDQMGEAHFELANTGGSMVRLTGAPTVKMLEGC